MEADRGRATAWWVLGVLGVLGAFGVWGSTARLPEYVVSTTARVEAHDGAQPLSAPVAGVVVATHLSLGQTVHAGDVILELDAELETRRLAEANAKMASMERESTVLKHMVLLEQAVIEADEAAEQSSVVQQEAQEHVAELSEDLSKVEAERASRLESAGVISESELERALATAKVRQAERAVQGRVIERTEGERKTKTARSFADIEKLRGDIDTLESQKSALEKSAAVLAYELEQRTVRAPRDGTVGAIEPTVVVGSFVRAGDPLGSIVPAAPLRIVSTLAAGDALGRVREGQPARVRLSGFPWADHGFVNAHVARVADEPTAGQVRVELDVDSADPRIHLEHGLTGTAEIEVERTTPLAMVLRTIGRAASP